MGDRDMLTCLVRRLEGSGLLGEAERQALLAVQLSVRQVPARADIRVDHDPGGAFLVLSGVACRYEMLADGTRRIVALYFPGDLCASGPAIAVAPPGTIGALSACTIADIPFRTIVDLVRTHPGIERALWWLATVELGIAQQWLINFGRTAERRVAHLVCEIQARLRASGHDEGGSCSNGIRQGAIADVTALSAVHVNRVLNALKAHRLITLTKGAVTIAAPDRLTAFAGFDPAYLHLPGCTVMPGPERAITPAVGLPARGPDENLTAPPPYQTGCPGALDPAASHRDVPGSQAGTHAGSGENLAWDRVGTRQRTQGGVLAVTS